MTTPSPATWTYRLAAVPTYALEGELARRGEILDRETAVELPGLRVEPLDHAVTWRGDAYVVGGRKMEVLYCLAIQRSRGHRLVSVRRLAQTVWRGWDLEDARKSARVVVCELRKQFPGLIRGVKSGQTVAYELAMDEEGAE